MSLTEPLHHHHKHCDDLFAAAEAAIGTKDWKQGGVLMVEFAANLETHFRTEEEILFPAFEGATGMTGGPTQMMRFEHAQMRELVAQMTSALESGDADTFGGAAETLLILMQQHNMKEENMLYPMCDQHLSAETPELLAHIEAELGQG